MSDERLIHDLFPHRTTHGDPSFRPHQFEIIRDVLDAFDDGVEDVIVEAPTGTGKTDIAKTVALVMTNGYQAALPAARRKGSEEEIFAELAPHQAHMITSMKMLQDAYLNTPGEVKLIKGKSNYVCVKDPKQTTLDVIADSLAGQEERAPLTCRDADLFFGTLCAKGCPYQRAKRDAQFAAVALHNFESFLNQGTLGGVFGPRRLLTIDEGHNTEERLAQFMAMDFTSRQFDRMDLPWTRLDSEDGIEEWAKLRHAEISRQLEKDRANIATVRSVGKKVDYHAAKAGNRLVKRVRAMEEIHTKLGRYLSSIVHREGYKPARWVVDYDAERVGIEPVEAGRFVKSALLRFGQHRLHLSATFLESTGAYSRALKIKSGMKFMSVPSTFPVASRRIKRAYAGNMRQAEFDKNWSGLVDKVREVMRDHAHERGVVHCTSYAIAERLFTSLSDERVLAHDKRSRESTVGWFMSGHAPEDAVLLAVGLTEGYDFKDDLCRFQVITRIPYPYPGKRLLARKEVDPQYMDWRTCLTLVQTYGRGVRSATDRCVTYVLDSRFDRFINANRRQLPDWFLEAAR